MSIRRVKCEHGHTPAPWHQPSISSPLQGQQGKARHKKPDVNVVESEREREREGGGERLPNGALGLDKTAGSSNVKPTFSQGSQLASCCCCCCWCVQKEPS